MPLTAEMFSSNVMLSEVAGDTDEAPSTGLVDDRLGAVESTGAVVVVVVVVGADPGV